MLRSKPDSFSTTGLTLVSVGPGDPSLLTVAAVEAIRQATLIAYPVSRSGEQGLAAQIASSWIQKEKHQLPIEFPMVEEASLRRDAWRQASDQLAAAVAEGEEVVLLCQGDVSVFATSSYVLLDMKKTHPECKVRLIPGVTSFSAAAAAGLWPLCLQQDQLLVAPTPDTPEILEELLEDAGILGRVVVLMKLGSRWKWVRQVLEDLDLLEGSLFAQRVGLPDQLIVNAKDVPASSRTYFSLLLIRQAWPEVLP